MIQILIGGDICPINSNEAPFIKEDGQFIFDSFANQILHADLSIANLEAPLTNYNKKSLKTGANIKANPKTIIGIKKSGFDLLSIANNHIGDYGEQGIKDTISLCKANNISTVGAGTNKNSAAKPIIFEKEGKKIGILSFADTEFGIVSDTISGANPLDIIDATITVEELKTKTDFIVVLLHEGKEYYNYPSPQLQKICRHIINRGADIVVCQHSHVIGAWEKYKKGNIFYGQGNLIFDYANRKSKEWISGFFIKIVLTNENNNISLIPYEQKMPGIKPLNKNEEILFYDKMDEMSKKVLDKTFIAQNWIDFSNSFEPLYLSILQGHGKYKRKLYQMFGLHKRFLSENRKLTILNIIRSRVHRETLITAINNSLIRDKEK